MRRQSSDAAASTETTAVPQVLDAIIALAGKSGSGKSTLSRNLQHHFIVRCTSFGSFVRSQAQQRGEPLDIPSLQAFGQSLIDQLGPDRFVDDVIEWSHASGLGIDRACPMILDGVRSEDIWHAIQRRASQQTFLIYLDVDEPSRVQRIMNRGQQDQTELLSILAHPMEAGIPSLKSEASLILTKGDEEMWTRQVLDFLASNNLVLSKRPE